MFSTIYLISSSVFGILMVILYLIKYKGTSIKVWKPIVAWIRAFIYFSLCNIIIAISGTLAKSINQPLFSSDQITNPYWLFYLSICFVYIFFTYWILWSRMTLTFDRKYYLLIEIIFGMIWGFSTGGLLLSFYHLWSLTGLASWIRYILTYISIGVWQYFAHDYFWDVYVSPEHDTPRSIIIKTYVCHIPNVALTLGFLTIWNNYAIYIVFNIFALVATTIFQKFPAPWVKGSFHAPMVKSGIFRFFRGTGFIKETQSS